METIVEALAGVGVVFIIAVIAAISLMVRELWRK
jgi:hypothetical protein